jgi:hypothetical protein
MSCADNDDPSKSSTRGVRSPRIIVHCFILSVIYQNIFVMYSTAFPLRTELPSPTTPSPLLKALDLLPFLLPCRLLLFQPKSYRPLNPFLQTHNRPIPQPPLRLPTIVIPRHTTKPHNPSLKRRIFPNSPNNPLHNRRQNQPHIFAYNPHMFRAFLITSRFPHRARKIPEIHRLVIRDDEGFAVDFFMV